MLKTLPTGLHHHIKPKSVRDLQIVHSSLVSGEQYFSLVSHPEKQNFPNFVWIRRRHDLLSICWIEGRIRIDLFFHIKIFRSLKSTSLGWKQEKQLQPTYMGEFKQTTSPFHISLVLLCFEYKTQCCCVFKWFSIFDHCIFNPILVGIILPSMGSVQQWFTERWKKQNKCEKRMIANTHQIYLPFLLQDYQHLCFASIPFHSSLSWPI